MIFIREKIAKIKIKISAKINKVILIKNIMSFIMFK